ncbi:hypothetical protein KIM372_06140 [Bombiscardovia nodaiensis]|uniref:Uncharacterized protein n=1 Tax=Bombiscardovia nodaiensis TaxID=2932181 RepID=A0ABN6S966_9BIFI|nr:hypothetical protein KIM372_06140 [Bombiscardovia nodaiensis]
MTMSRTTLHTRWRYLLLTGLSVLVLAVLTLAALAASQASAQDGQAGSGQAQEPAQAQAQAQTQGFSSPLLRTPPEVAPYVEGGELAKSLLIYRGSQTKDHAYFSGDWTKPDGDSDQLRFWQDAARPNASLTVCVRDTQVTSREQCLTRRSQDPVAGKYAVSTSLQDLTNLVGQSPLPQTTALSATLTRINQGDPSPGYIYVKLGSELNVGGQTFLQDQIVKIPVVADYAAPEISDLTVYAPDSNTPLDVDALDIANKAHSVSRSVLRASRDGIDLQFKVVESESGVDLDRVGVAYAGQEYVLPAHKVDADHYWIRLNVDALNLPRSAVGSVNLSLLKILVADKAGNKGLSQALDTVEPFLASTLPDGHPLISLLKLYDIPSSLDFQLTGSPACQQGGVAGPCSSSQAQPSYVQAASGSVSPQFAQKDSTLLTTLADFAPQMHYETAATIASNESTATAQGPGQITGSQARASLPAQDAYTLHYTLSFDNPGMVTLPTSTLLAYVVVDDTPPVMQVADATAQQVLDHNKLPLLPNKTGLITFQDPQDPSRQAHYQFHLQDRLGGCGPTCPVFNGAGDQPGSSGIDWAKSKLSYVRFDTVEQLKQGRPGRQESVSLNENAGPGTADVTFHESGLYQISSLALTAKDRAGNTLNQSQVWTAADQPKYDYVLVVGADYQPTAQLDVRDQAGNPASQDHLGPGGSAFYHRGSVQVKVSVNDHWFALSKGDQGGACPTIEGRVGGVASDDQQTFTSDICQLTQPDQSGQPDLWTATYTLPSAPGDSQGRPIEGAYQLHFSYTAAGGASVSADQTLGIDYSGPAVGLSDQANAELKRTHLVRLDDGTTVLATHPAADGQPAAGSQSQVELSLAEVRGCSSNCPPVQAGQGDQAGTSGVDWQSVNLTYVRYDNLKDARAAIAGSPNAPQGQSVTVALKDTQAAAQVTFAEDGVYPTEQMMISAKDQAGNSLSEYLWSKYSGKAYQLLLVQGPKAKAQVELRLEDAPGNPASEDHLGPGGASFYHRGSLTVNLRVNDPSFDVNRRILGSNAAPYSPV